MHVVETFGEPVVLPTPVSLVFWIDVVQIGGDQAVLSVRQFPPFQRKAKAPLNLLTLGILQAGASVTSGEAATAG